MNKLNFNEILEYYLNLIEQISMRHSNLSEQMLFQPQINDAYDAIRENIESMDLEYQLINDYKLTSLIIEFMLRINYKTLDDVKCKVNWLLLRSFGEKYDGI